MQTWQLAPVHAALVPLSNRYGHPSSHSFGHLVSEFSLVASHTFLRPPLYVRYCNSNSHYSTIINHQRTSLQGSIRTNLLIWNPIAQSRYYARPTSSLCRAMQTSKLECVSTYKYWKYIVLALEIIIVASNHCKYCRVEMVDQRGVNTSFYNIKHCRLTEKKCGIKLIGLVKTTPLYLKLAPYKGC